MPDPVLKPGKPKPRPMTLKKDPSVVATVPRTELHIDVLDPLGSDQPVGLIKDPSDKKLPGEETSMTKPKKAILNLGFSGTFVPQAKPKRETVVITQKPKPTDLEERKVELVPLATKDEESKEETVPVVPAIVTKDEESKEETDTTVPLVAPVVPKTGRKPLKISSGVLKQTVPGVGKKIIQTQTLEQLTDSELKELAEAIFAIEEKNPYRTPVPAEGYLPENRRAFQDFILKTYSEFKLSLPPTNPDYDACDKLTGSATATMYQYQEFVRDYMRWQSPYRGLLIYHGLGSGKTCSAIAAAEALFSQGDRRIIVLTPASLQGNFLKEISFCGFEHFRLNNNWIGVPNEPTTQPLFRIFAEKVLKIPKQYLDRSDVKTVWIPDFRKDGSQKARESKPFAKLDDNEQQQVRDQIENIVFRVDSDDPKKARHGRIQFISYNGVSSEKLREMLNKTGTEAGFDNAVIIIDEVHNIVRNMRGQIDPFLIDIKSRTKRITFDPITYEPWKPKQTVSYSRGILFYRLLAGARNSKIIGLSGTPLINFPEEIGILMNVLHGYNHIGKATITSAASTRQGLEKIKLAFEQAAAEFQYTDFYEAIVDSAGVYVTATMLPEGIRKLKEKQTVERIPMNLDYVSFPDRFKKFEDYLREKGIFGKEMKFTISSEPLLPPTNEAFANYFKLTNNDDILMRRMSGLVSYYKGSRKDLMPEKFEEVVLCPMSLYSQKYYLNLRIEEIGLEKASKDKKKKSKGAGELSKFWALAYDIDNLDIASSWRVASRQACNFSFPPNVRRPRVVDVKDLYEETGPESDIYLDDMMPTGDTTNVPQDEDAESQITNSISQEAEDKAKAGKEDIEALEKQLADTIASIEEEFKAGTIDETTKLQRIEEASEELNEYKRGTAVFIEEKERLDLIAEEEAKDFSKRCLAGLIRADEGYDQRIARAIECLRVLIKDRKDIAFGKNLVEYSSKYEQIIKKMNQTQGSNLLYSTYLSMEGLGIFTMILDSMGWEKIVIERSGKTLNFSKETAASIRKGPDANINRYIFFTGGEDNKVRKAAINVFNMNTKDLPGELTRVLNDGGFKENTKGNLCRLFCITSAGAEGLSLQNVRAVHIMEPHWNDVRLSQVKGRAIRICSHKALDVKDRNVRVYIYLSTFSDLTQVLSSNDKISDPALLALKTKQKDKLTEWALPNEVISEETEKVSADEMRSILKGSGATIHPDIQSMYYATTDIILYRLGILKREMTDRIQKLMKRGAVDCELNFNENKEEDKDKAFQCVKYGQGGDFLYHPSLIEDVERWSKTQFTAKKYKTVKIKGIDHVLVPVTDDSGKITEFQVYPADDIRPESMWGTINADDTQQPKKDAAARHPKV